MLTLTDRGLTLQVNNPASLTTAHYFQSKQCVIVGTEIAGHGGLAAAVSGCFIFALVILLKNFVSSNY